MNWLGALVVFAISWWLVLFMTLPFGSAPPAEVERGHASSAPAKPRLALKMAITTVIAALVTAITYWVIEQEFIQLRPTVG